MSRVKSLALGEWITLDGEELQIVGFADQGVRLRTADGRPLALLATELLRYGRSSRAPLDGADPPAMAANRHEHLDHQAILDVLPPQELQRVRALEEHIREVITGFRAGAPSGDELPNPNYLPDEEITKKIATKFAELQGTPLECSDRTLWRYRTNYLDQGAWGLVNRAKVRISDPLAGLDPRVREAILEQAQVEVAESTASLPRFCRRVERRLTLLYGPYGPVLPRDRTFRRRIEELLRLSHPTNSAQRRRNLAEQPKGVHGHAYAVRPGQVVMMDSNRVDVFAFDPLTGQTLPLELTLAIDLYTRSIVAWRFTPLGANAVDAVLLLADMLTPESLRPGWAEHLRWAYYGLPVERAFSLDERLEAAAARPIIWPETLVVDNGKIFVSRALIDACLRLGINLQFARLDKPTDKPEVERAFKTINTQFVEHLAGHKGRSVENRGSDPEGAARFTLDEINEFFAELVVAVYQRRVHSGLKAAGAPHIPMSPNDKWIEGIAVAGALPMPRSLDLYMELLPIEHRQVHAYGVQVDKLIYNGPALDNLNMRGRRSPYPGGLWPIRKDPRNRLQVFIKNTEDGSWHPLTWVHAENWLEPFTDLTLQYVIDNLAARGHTHPDADEVAAALHDLQRRIDAPEAASAADLRRLTRDRARAQSTRRDQARAQLVSQRAELDDETMSDAPGAPEDDVLDLTALTTFGYYGQDPSTTEPITEPPRRMERQSRSPEP